MSRLPVIVGFGGVNPAGRSSFHHGFRRMVIDKLPVQEATETYVALGVMMGVVTWDGNQLKDQEGNTFPKEDILAKYGEYIKEHTLIRRVEIEHFDADHVHYHKPMNLDGSSDDLQIKVKEKELPNDIPENWEIGSKDDSGKILVTIKNGMKVFFADTKKLTVQSAGQLPRGFNPGAQYASKNHPRGLQMSVWGASDALYSLGFEWEEVLHYVRPEDVGVYASSCMGQVDDDSAGGYARAGLLGKRPSTKQMAFSLADMPADFVNAYVLGSVGHTCASLGACATFLFNLYNAIVDIQSGKRRVAFVGSSESGLNPEIMEAYRVMSALSEDGQILALDKEKGLTQTDHRRACRPFSYNAGFTLAESSQYIVLFDDSLAMEMGTMIHGAVADVFLSADGFKKSISQPGIGNYVTLAKAAAMARSILGDDALKNRSFIHAHGTGTPANRTTESHGLNETARAFGIENWPVAAVKSYLGHPTGPASGDQIVASLGTWKYGLIPGIKTIDGLADDIFNEHLNILTDHMETTPDYMQCALINSKGFGGNNGTGLILSPQVTTKMLESRYGAEAMKQYAGKNEKIQEKIQETEEKNLRGENLPIYKFGTGVVEGDELEITDKSIKIPGFERPVDLEMENPYKDMKS